MEEEQEMQEESLLLAVELDVAFVAWVIRAAKGIRIGPALCQGTKYSELLLML